MRLVVVLALLTSPLLAQSPLAAAKWEKVKVPTEASFRGLSLPADNVIWASGTQHTVIRSLDGGKTWKRFEVGPKDPKLDFRDVWALDAQTAWIMGAGPMKASCIYVTRDGGKTWKEEHTNTLEGAFFDGFTFLDNQRGMVYSDPVDGAFLLRMREGKSWKRLAPKIPASLPGEASFAASGTGIISQGKHIWFGTGGAKVARVFHSSDEGATWQVGETPLRAGDGAAGVFSLAFRNATHGVVVGGKYNEPNVNTQSAAYTTNGGKTWKLSRVMPRGFRSCVEYVPGMEKTLLTAGTSGAEYSLDDGYTWKPMGEHTINVLKCANGNEAWAVGPDANVLRLVW